MRKLIIDVSTDTQIVILSVTGQPEIIKTRLGKKDHSAYMIPLIDETLKEGKTSIKEIDQIIVGIGPGSYTGLRVAVMTAKMLAYTNKKPLYTISSLQLLASGYDGKITAMIDARNQNYFSGGYDQSELILKEGLYHIDELMKHPNHIIIDHETIKIDLSKISHHFMLVENPHELTPNYLRITEAERNHDQKNNH